MEGYEKVSQGKLLKVWEDVANCEVLTDGKCFSFATGGGKGTLFIFKRNSDLIINPDDVLIIRIIRDAAYIFKTRVRSINEGVITYYRLELPREGVRIQRRDDFRLKIKLPIRYKEFDHVKSALIKDISAGGLKMIHKEPIKIGAEISLEIKLNDDVLLLKGIVKRSQKTPKGYLTGLEFTCIEECKREIIIKFIFEETRKRRNKKVY